MRTTGTFCKSILIAMIAIAGFGCGGGGTPKSQANNIVGKWTETNMSINGSTTPCPGNLPNGGNTVDCFAATLVLVPNGVYTVDSEFNATQLDLDESGTWAASDGRISFSSGSGQVAMPYALSVDGRTLTISVKAGSGFGTTNGSGSTTTWTEKYTFARS